MYNNYGLNLHELRIFDSLTIFHKYLIHKILNQILYNHLYNKTITFDLFIKKLDHLF